jgi:hypothetical protein
MLEKTPRRTAVPASADAAAVDSNELQRKTSRRGRPKGTHKLDPYWYTTLVRYAYLIELELQTKHRPKRVSKGQIAELLKRRKQYQHLTTGRLRQYLPGNRGLPGPALRHSTDRMSAREFVKFHIDGSMWSLWLGLFKTPDENQMIRLTALMNDLRAGSVELLVEQCSLPTMIAERIVRNTARLVLLHLMKRFYAPFFPSEWVGRGIRRGHGFVIHPARVNFRVRMILHICDPLLETESAEWLTNLERELEQLEVKL